MSEKNKAISLRYHELDPDHFDEILTPDFVGRSNWPGHTWDLESHKRFWTANRDTAKDVIHEQIAEGDWVATRFTRRGTWKGKQIELDVMHFKRFEGDKIAEIWEYWNPAQLEA